MKPAEAFRRYESGALAQVCRACEEHRKAAVRAAKHQRRPLRRLRALMVAMEADELV